MKLPKEVAFFAYQNLVLSFQRDARRRVSRAECRLAAAVHLRRVSGEEIYAWSPNIVRHNGDANINIHLPKSDLLLGSLLSTWEGGEIGHIELLTDRGAAMAERSWNEHAGKTWEDFNRRLKPAMARLEAIQYPMGVTVRGADRGQGFPALGCPLGGRHGLLRRQTHDHYEAALCGREGLLHAAGSLLHLGSRSTGTGQPEKQTL